MSLSSSSSSSVRLREKGNAIFKNIDAQLAPTIRESRLKEALTYYNKALTEAVSDLEKSSACKNIMMASNSILT